MKLFIALILLTVPALVFATPPVEKGLASYYDDSFHGRKTASGQTYDKNKYTAAHKTLPFGTKVRVKNPANGKTVDVVINDRGPYIKGRVIEISKRAAQQIDLLNIKTAPVELSVLTGPEANKPAPVAAATSAETKPAETKPAAAAPETTAKTSSSTSSTKSTSKPAPKQDNIIAEASEMKPGGFYKMQVLKLQPEGFGVQVAGYSDYQSVVQQLAVLQKNWFKGANVFVDELDGKPYYKVILGPMTTRAEAQSYCESLKKKYNMKGAFVVDLKALADKNK